MRAAIVTTGFATTVGLWAVGYVARLPGIVLPAPAVLFALLALLVGAGVVAARNGGLGPGGAAASGALTGTLNLLILGSFLAGGPGAAIGIPGSILVCAALLALGARLGRGGSPEPPDWTAWFCRVTVAAAFLLLGVGGLVTSNDAGLAVVDWPNSFGYNMFLYPFSRMTGGIYYEHAHRLFGALVGLTTLAQAILLHVRTGPGPLRRLGWTAFVLVVAQGILGGLRVTGSFTTSTAPEDMTPSVALAAVHGVSGQIFFGLLVWIAACASTSWRARSPERPRTASRADLALAATVVAAVMIQLVLGAVQRHLSVLLFPHIVWGVAIVAPLAIHAGFRVWGRQSDAPILGRTGLGLSGAVVVQVFLGFVAYALRDGVAPGQGAIAFRTLHQWFGAVVLGLSVLLAAWSFRLLRPVRQDESESSETVATTPAADRVY